MQKWHWTSSFFPQTHNIVNNANISIRGCTLNQRSRVQSREETFVIGVFCFHVVKPQMPILVLLKFRLVCEKLWNIDKGLRTTVNHHTPFHTLCLWHPPNCTLYRLYPRKSINKRTHNESAIRTGWTFNQYYSIVQWIFTVGNSSCGKAMFSQACVKNSVGGCIQHALGSGVGVCIPACRRMSVSQHALGRGVWQTPLRVDIPWTDPPGQTHPWADTPLGRHPIGRHPPQAATAASYWNAFLLVLLFMLIIYSQLWQ